MDVLCINTMVNERRNDEFGTADISSQLPPAIDPGILESEDVFGVLAHPRRRFLLCVFTLDDRWTLPALATRLAAWEHDIDETAVDDRLHKRMYVSLYHTHVPRLEKARAIRFDERTETIVPGEYTEELLTVLDGVSDSLR